MSFLIKLCRKRAKELINLGNFNQSVSKFQTFNVVRCLSYINQQSSVSNFIPSSSVNNPWIWRQPDPITLPVNISNSRQNLPEITKVDIALDIPFNNDSKKSISEPVSNIVIKKEAARLIVIRRKKMKKHKLRKLRKKMKFEWAKLRQKRELAKEKVFQAELIAQCKKAKEFDAEKYVAEKLRLAAEVSDTSTKFYNITLNRSK